MAISENEFEPAKILWADVAKDTSAGIMHIIETAEESPIATTDRCLDYQQYN